MPDPSDLFALVDNYMAEQGFTPAPTETGFLGYTGDSDWRLVSLRYVAYPEPYSLLIIVKGNRTPQNLN